LRVKKIRELKNGFGSIEDEGIEEELLEF